MADPPVFRVEPFEHRGVELLAGAVARLAVGVAAAGGKGGGQLKDLLPLAQVGLESDSR